MAGIRLPAEDPDVSQAARQVAAVDLISDDDRSVAADSWSIKSDYGSTLDDEQRQADASEALSASVYRAASDYRSFVIPINILALHFLFDYRILPDQFRFVVNEMFYCGLLHFVHLLIFLFLCFLHFDES